MSKVLSRIESALQTGEVLTVTYNGGSQPGVARQLVPVKFQGSDKVRARCLLSGMTQCFVIEKLSIIDDETGEITLGDIQEPVHPPYENLKTVYDELLPLVEAAALHLELSDESITLHRKFKNGKVMKSDVACISYSEFKSELIFDLDANDFIEKRFKTTRPWYVSCTGYESTTFSSFQNAADRFVLWVTKMELIKGKS